MLIARTGNNSLQRHQYLALFLVARRLTVVDNISIFKDLEIVIPSKSRNSRIWQNIEGKLSVSTKKLFLKKRTKRNISSPIY